MAYFVSVLITMGLHILLGLSAYAILMTGQLSFGQQGFFGISAYLSAIATTLWGWSLTPALLLGAIVSGGIAVMVGFPTLRLRGIYFSVATFAFGEMVRHVFLNLKVQKLDPALGLLVGPDQAQGFPHITYLQRHGWTHGDYLWLVYGVVVLATVSFSVLERSKLGARLRAVEEDDQAAAMVGINVTALKVLAFALSGLVAGIGGGLYAHYTTFVSPEYFGLGLAISAVAYPMIGGLGTFVGPLVGAAFLIFLTEFLRILHGYRMIVYGGLIVLTMIFRPRGLLDEALLLKLKAKGRKRSALSGQLSASG